MTTPKKDEGALPPLPAGAPGRPPAGRYREQYGVIIVCPSEEAQRAIWAAAEALRACKLRIVVT